MDIITIQILTIISTIFFVVASKYKTGTFINPVAIFTSWWGFTVILSSLDLIGLYFPSIETFQIILFAIVMFGLGSFTFIESNFDFSNKTKMANMNDNLLRFSEESTSTKLQIYFYFQIFISIVLLLFLKKGLGMLMTMDSHTYRTLVYSEAGIFEGYKLFVKYILKPAVYFSFPAALAGVYLGVLKKRFLYITLLNIVLYSTVIIGRFAFFMVILSFFFGFFYVKDLKNLKFKIKYIIILLIPISLVISMSLFRTGNDSLSILDLISDYFVWYFTGNYTIFDYFLNTVDHGVEYNFTIFRATFGGIEEILSPFIKKLLTKDFDSVIKSIHEFTTVFRNIGGGKNHNSNYTMLFTFYRDGGVLAVGIYTYLFGVVNSLVYNNYRKKATISNLTVVIFLTYLSIMGVLRWEFMYAWAWFVIFYSIYFLKNYYKIYKSNVE